MSAEGERDHDEGQRPEVAEAAEILGRVLEREQQSGVLDATAELESLAPDTRAILEGMLEDVRRIRSHRASIGAPPAAGDTIGRYKLLELLGRGSSSTVWRARDSHVGRFVAVKVLHPEHGLSERQLRRFERESRIAGGLSDPSVLTLLDIGVDRGLHYIVLECIEGGQTLRHLLEEERRVVRPPSFDRRSARFLLQVAEAVGMLHDKGIVHRDLKPANILIRSTGVPVVGDLGLATDAEDRSMATSRSGAGSPFYRSPEQVREERDLDARSDVFSLGVVIYEALTSRRPFEGSSTQEVNQRILDRDPRPLRQIRRQIPGDLETICMQALEKDPGRRYADANGLAEDLRRFLDHRPILARRASSLRRLAKVARRRPIRTTSVVSLVLLLLIGAYALRTMARERLVARSALATAEEALRVLAPGSDLDPARTMELVEVMASAARERVGTSPAERARQLLAASRFAMKFGHFELATEVANEAIQSAGEALESGDASAHQLLMDARLAGLEGLGEAKEYVQVEELARVYLAEAPRPGLEHQRCLLLLEATTALAARQETDALLALEEEHGNPVELAADLMADLERADRRDASLRRLELRESLAEYHHSRHQYTEAYELLEGVFGELRDRYGLHHHRTIRAGILLGRTLHWGITEHAIEEDPDWTRRELAELLWPVARETLGDDARTTIITRWLLAEATLHEGDTEQALAHYEGVQRSLLTWESPDSDRNRHLTEALAVVLMHCGRHEEAEPIFRRMIRVRTETLGADHFDTLVPLGGLAQALESMGRYDEILVLFEGMYASQLRQRDVLNPMMLFNVPRATARIEMFSGRLDRLEEALGWINRLAEELDVPEQLLTPEAQQLARSCAVMNAAMAAGDSPRATALAEEILAAIEDVDPGSSSDTSAGSVMQSWTGRQSVRTAAAVRMLTGQELEVAPWMGDELRLSVHYRRGELEEAREILRGEINKILRAVNFDGRKTCSVVWYLTRVLGEELEAIPAGERTPEESRLLEAIQRAL